jgi:enterochelin esterase family protein
MQKDAQGVWSFTTEPIEPDYYGYCFFVDGARVIDPSNPLLKYNLLNIENQVHVPGPASLAWELNDVPRGELHRHFYRSKAAGDDRDLVVLEGPQLREVHPEVLAGLAVQRVDVVVGHRVPHA